MAAFLGGTLLFRKSDANIEIRQLAVFVRDEKCPALESMPKVLMQPHPCGTAEITLASADGREWRFSMSVLTAREVRQQLTSHTWEMFS